MRYFFLALLIALIVGGVSVSAHGDDHNGAIGEFVEGACPFEVAPSLVVGEDIICGEITVPQFHDSPEYDTFVIGVSVLKSTSSDPAPDPLFMNTGGPGGSTALEVDSYLFETPVGQSLLAQRDVVLMEVRGSLFTEPYLFCDPLFDLTVPSAEILEDAELEVALLDATATCQAEWEARGIHLNAFNSLEIVADMVMTAEALGYDTFSYYGVSYGTVFGQHLLRDHGEYVRSAIFDAVSSLTINYIPKVPNNADRVFGLMFEYCQQDAYCSANHPDLEDEFIAVIERLNAEPRPITFTHPATGETHDVLLSGDFLIETLFSLMYSAEAIAIVPDIIGLLADDAGIANLVMQQLLPVLDDFSREMSLPLGILVTCAEDGDIEADEFNVEDVRPYLLPAMESYLPLMICDWFDIPLLGDKVDEPVASDVPVLVLSGELDPITPPAWGDVVAEHLTNAYVYTFPGVGHGVFNAHDCPNAIVLDFLENPEQEPDASCIADMGFAFTNIFED